MNRYTTLKQGDTVQFYYTNHKGERELRHVKIIGVDVAFGSELEAKYGQLFGLRCEDLDREGVLRTFAFLNIEPDTVERLPKP